MDLAIAKTFEIKVSKSKASLVIPVIAIECKTYLDNTMFSETQFTAQKLKNGTPSVKTYIVTLRNEIKLDRLPSTSPIDEVYVIGINDKKDFKGLDSIVVFDMVKEFNVVLKKAESDKKPELPGKLLHPDK